MQNPLVIAITGASSGLGAALARHYARPGITLGLLGRNAERLEATAQACRHAGATVESAAIDVCEKEAMAQWLMHFNAAHPVDLLIANAGISAGLGNTEAEPPEQVRAIFAVNVDGVFNTVLPLLPLMQARGKGQIAIMSSLAGIRGIPSCPAYSASKSAVRAWGEGLRGALKKSGVSISVICPGYVHTNMTAGNQFPMPFIMSAEKAACIIARGLAANRARIAFPLSLYIPLLFLSFLPLFITDPFFAALPRKTAMEKP